MKTNTRFAIIVTAFISAFAAAGPLSSAAEVNGNALAYTSPRPPPRTPNSWNPQKAPPPPRPFTPPPPLPRPASA